jgi:hypothetical protein
MENRHKNSVVKIGCAARSPGTVADRNAGDQSGGETAP